MATAAWSVLRAFHTSPIPPLSILRSSVYRWICCPGEKRSSGIGFRVRCEPGFDAETQRRRERQREIIIAVFSASPRLRVKKLYAHGPTFPNFKASDARSEEHTSEL